MQLTVENKRQDTIYSLLWTSQMPACAEWHTEKRKKEKQKSLLLDQEWSAFLSLEAVPPFALLLSTSGGMTPGIMVGVDETNIFLTFFQYCRTLGGG